jgi:dTDP-4-dehydrorhamnose 3,5-epimerase-like enzyme
MNGLTITELEVSRDARGWSAHPLDEAALSAGAFANVHLVSMEPGAIRGNHKHIEQTEHVMIVGGPVLFTAEDAETGERFERVFQPEEHFRVTAAPGVAHAFKNIGDSVAYLLCASGRAFDPVNTDTERVVLFE